MCFINPEFLNTIKGARVIPVNKEGYILWHIREDKITSDMDKMKVIMSFENGFKLLEKEFYPIQFKSTSYKEEAPIVIGFFNDSDPDLPTKFGEHVLAYAYGNYANFKYSSDMFFNDKYQWAELNNENIFNLKKTFVHECMHALGFEHSDIQNDILFWQYQPNDDIIFSQDTRDAIQKYYAAEMAKVPKVPVVPTAPELGLQNEKRFVKNILNFKSFGLSFRSHIIESIGSFFNLNMKKGRNRDNYNEIVKYLDA